MSIKSKARRELVIFLLFISISTISISGKSWSQTSSWLRDEQSGVSFAYRPPWVRASASEKATLFVVNWLGKQGGIVATCYLQTYANSPLSHLPKNQIHQRKAEITSNIMNNMEARYSDVKLRSSESNYVDGYPVIFLIRDGSVTSMNETTTLRAWSLVTSWQKHEIALECASPIPHQFPNSDVVKVVEDEIMRILKTLHFER